MTTKTYLEKWVEYIIKFQMPYVLPILFLSEVCCSRFSLSYQGLSENGI